MIHIAGATVVTPEGLTRADVLVEGKEVVEVGSPGRPNEAHGIDADGMILGPGLVDLHVHFREPGQTWKEDVESGTMTAAAGGFTAVVMMPNTVPALDNPEAISNVVERAGGFRRVEVKSAGAITRGREGVELADIGPMYELGVRMFTDDGDHLDDPALLAKAMAFVAGLPGALIADHAEDRTATLGRHIHQGTTSHRLGLDGIPSHAEYEVVSQDIDLAGEAGCPLHLQHLSSAESVGLVAAAKDDGLPVTAEVTPHHLTFTEEDVTGQDPNLKMYPPLRTKSDRSALVAALRAGVIDAVATDHAPHTIAEKSTSFALAPRGVVGLETAMGATFDCLGGDVLTMFRRMSVGPARLGRFARQGRLVEGGSPANLVLVDPNSTGPVGEFHSKSSNSPFIGKTLGASVVLTVFEGNITYQWGER